jgi:hypothetical protein
MEVVGTRFDDGIDDSASGSAELRVVIRGLNRYFLNSVGNLDLKCLSGHRNIVILSSIQQKVIRASPSAIHRECRCTGVILTTLMYPRQRNRKHSRISRIDREIQRLSRVDVSARTGASV